MGISTRTSLLLMLLAATVLAGDDPIDLLIKSLGDKDPQVRVKAEEALLREGDRARDKLVAATRSPKLAISTTAQILLTKLPWSRSGDSAIATNILKEYGNRSEIERTGILHQISLSAPDGAQVLVRVLSQEKSPVVQWNVAMITVMDENWKAATNVIEEKNASPPLLLLLGRQRLASGDMHSAKPLIQRAFETGGDSTTDTTTSMLLTMYDLTASLDLHAEAAKLLERAIDRNEGDGFALNRGNLTEAWPANEVRAKVTWHRMKDAELRKDEKAIEQQTAELLGHQTTDMAIFLDVISTIQQSAPADKVDTYFQRVYARQREKIAAEPDDPVHQNDLAWLLARSGRKLEEALSNAEAAVKAKPAEPGFMDTLAETKFRLGQIDEAIEIETKALQLLPDDTFMKEQLERYKKAKASAKP